MKKNLPIKSESKGIQKAHIRRYSNGKKVVVNPENKKVSKANKKKSSIGKTNNYSRKEEDKKNYRPKITPKITLKPRIHETEAQRKKSWEKQVKLMTAAATFPLITWRGQEESYPELIKDKIKMMRLIQLMKDQKDFEEYATDEEALGYISTMSLVAPLDNEMLNIMTYLYNKVMPGKVPKDLEMLRPLYDNERMLLNKLKRSIRKSQWREFNNKQVSKK